MKKKVSAFFAAILMLHASPAWSDDSTVNVTVVPITQSSPAPFTGLLITPEAAATLMSTKKLASDFTAAEVKKAVDTQDAKCNFQLKEKDVATSTIKTISAAELATRDNAIRSLGEQLKKEQDAAKWNKFYVAAGFVGGAAVTILGGFAISQVMK